METGNGSADRGRFSRPPARRANKARDRNAPGDHDSPSVSNTSERPGGKGSWTDVAPLVARELSRGTFSRKDAWDFSLVLSARGVDHHVEQARGPLENQEPGPGWRILCPAGSADRAVRELTSYVRENRESPVPVDEPVPMRRNVETTLWVLFALFLFHGLTRGGFSGLLGDQDWAALGSAQSRAIVYGDWWRLVTALTLHSNWAHVLGNVLIGALFFVPLCRELGTGLGWSLVLCSGVLGNYWNLKVHTLNHNSLGASTAVFGAIGILAGLRSLRELARQPGQRRPEVFRNLFLQVATGFALLAFLGTGGERTDLGAHLFGFLAGLLLGGGAGVWVVRKGLPGLWLDKGLALAALFSVIGAWLLALS